MKKLLLLFIISNTIESCWVDTRCSYNSPENVRLRVSYFMEGIDSAKIAYYVDSFYNVKIPYPDNFCVDKSSCSPGSARFCYYHYFEATLRLAIAKNYKKWDIDTAMDKQLRDFPALMCLTMGKDFFILGRPNGTIIKKCYLLNDKWVELSLSHGGYVENALGNVEKFIMDWEPEELKDGSQKDNGAM